MERRGRFETCLYVPIAIHLFGVNKVVCFFVDKGYRNQGLTLALLKAAAEYVRQHDGKIIEEGYPVEPKLSPMPPVFAYTGLASAFQKAGFVERARRSETRPIMRLHV